MKKIWGYISAITLGIIGGMILMYQIVKKNINSTSINVRKVKQKKTTDSVQDVTNQINQEAKKISREEKKKERKLKKDKKKALRKQNK